MAVKPIPEGYHSVTPYLSVKGGAAAIAFYEKAFGAKELFRMPAPGGKIGHAELQVGDCRIMLSDEAPEMGSRSPQTIGGSPVALMLYVDDVDATVKRALEAGATATRPVENQFYGDRSGGITDPFGHSWWVATHIEDVPPEEMEKRAAAAFAKKK
jgi:PhnB protein